MFEGKIRPCLKCGGKASIVDDGRHKALLECKCSIRDLNTNKVNQWNLANTPPEDITHLKYYYARFNMTLPGLEEVSK